MKNFAALLAALALLAIGCENQPDDPAPTEQPAQDEPTDQRQKTIDEHNQKVNERDDLEDLNGDTCPTPQQTDQMCAQVITWALSPEGKCCRYPTPCHAPEDWETFQSAEACEEAAEERR